MRLLPRTMLDTRLYRPQHNKIQVATAMVVYLPNRKVLLLKSRPLAQIQLSSW
jgi:hypothetical protein